MKVTVTYTDAYEDAPGGVEVVSSPYDADWEQCRVRWRHNASDGLWRLAIEKMEGGAWRTGASLLEFADQWADVGEYAEWLAVNVDRVEVDGQPFWVNDALPNDSMGSDYE